MSARLGIDGALGHRLTVGRARSRTPQSPYRAKSVQWHEAVIGGPPGDKFLRVIPDLVVEGLSPGDSRREMLRKIDEYLAAGVRLAWVIDPKKRRATIHRSATAACTLGEEDTLDGEDVVPRFRCRLADVLA